MKRAVTALFFILITVNGAAEFIELEEETVWTHYSPEKSLEKPSNYFNIVSERNIETDLMDRGWRYASGTNRYSYFNTTGDERWKTSDIQLEKGNYHGNRYHIRLYNSPWSDHTLGQAHYEHFNWLTVRHEVTSNENAMNKVKKDLSSEGLEAETGNKASLENIVILSALLAVLMPGKKVKMFLAFPGIILATRFLGIALSELLTVHPYVVTFPLYVTLVGGVLLLAVRTKNTDDRIERFLTVFLGISLGFCIDAFYTGGIPINEVVQKSVFALTAAFIAFSADSGTRTKWFSITLYLVWLLLMLFGYIT